MRTILFFVVFFGLISSVKAATDATAEFLSRDAVTKGDWKGKLGKTGYSLPGYETLLPKNIRLDWGKNVHGFVWEQETDDVRGTVSPMKGRTNRTGACRFAGPEPLEFDLNLGEEPRKITFYFCDWDNRKRSQLVQIFDQQSNLLHEVGLGSFVEGELLSWFAEGKIRVKITSQAETNGVINAVFIDPVTDEDKEKAEKKLSSSNKVASSNKVPPKNIVFLAGIGSHGFASHEHNAGSLYMAEILEEVAPVRCIVYLNCVPGMPFPSSCDSADCIVVYADGDGMYPLIGKAEQLETLLNRGCGFVFLHYATLPQQSSNGGEVISTSDFEFVKNASGAVYEHFWTVNPFFIGKFDNFVEHPVTNGLHPFSIYDEWYFHLRFKYDLRTDYILRNGDLTSVVPILVCIPPDEAKSGPDGTYSGNATVRERLGKPEIVASVIEREDGGRGFCFTGGDIHWNYAEPNYRKSLVNGILWTCKFAVPHNGFDTASPTFEELRINQDEPATLSEEDVKIFQQSEPPT